jgi:hypothetical protein
MNTDTQDVRIVSDLMEEQARQLAQLCKRIGFSDVRAQTTTNAEAYVMLGAIARLQYALAQAGYHRR